MLGVVAGRPEVHATAPEAVAFRIVEEGVRPAATRKLLLRQTQNEDVVEGEGAALGRVHHDDRGVGRFLGGDRFQVETLGHLRQEPLARNPRGAVLRSPRRAGHGTSRTRARVA